MTTFLSRPLKRKLIPTSASESYLAMSPDETGLPLAPHPGSFAAQRRFHQHEGVDLYGNKGEPVFAMAAGIVVAKYQFTGSAVDMPWWHDTWAVAIEDDAGIWVYGEIDDSHQWSPGHSINIDQRLGYLATVLKNDKGRPMTMLHLERWVSGSKPYTRNWLPGEPQPVDLLDPTPLLLEIE